MPTVQGMKSSRTSLFARVIVACVLVPSVTSLNMEGSKVSDLSNLLPSGVTSIISSTDGLLVTGTKTGRLFICQKIINGIGKDTAWEELDRKQYSPKYPIYSLALGKDTIFAGCGDRYVSVWTRQGMVFDFQRTLGPHTGWVKALAYCEDSNLLYSIGCNCIESWDVSDCLTTRHVSKRAIENSPDMGSTLSSDLLSLCLVRGKGLLSGGVDGRIHLWSLNPLEKEPIYSGRIHDGRVNAMVYASEMGMIFSVGHDGRVMVSRLEDDGRGFILISHLQVDESMSRLTTICVTEVRTNACRLVVGTTEGILFYIDVTSDCDTVIMKENSRLSIPSSPMVYSLSLAYPSVLSDEASIILVGHAQGMATVQF